MDDKEPRIHCVEHEDELEEELFFLRMNMDLLKKEERAKPYFQEMELRRKEIEMKLKLIRLQKDF